MAIRPRRAVIGALYKPLPCNTDNSRSYPSFEPSFVKKSWKKVAKHANRGKVMCWYYNAKTLCQIHGSSLMQGSSRDGYVVNCIDYDNAVQFSRCIALKLTVKYKTRDIKLHSPARWRHLMQCKRNVRFTHIIKNQSAYAKLSMIAIRIELLLGIQGWYLVSMTNALYPTWVQSKWTPNQSRWRSNSRSVRRPICPN